MAKIHITLVGGQPAPVYKGIIDEQPDKVVLVCSSGSKKQAVTIANYINNNIVKIRADIPSFISPNFVFNLLDPVDIRKTGDDIKRIDEKYITDQDEVSVNITSGTKPWSILFYSYFSKKANATCFYIDQNDMKYDFCISEPVKVNAPLDIDGTLRLNNIQVIQNVGISLYDQSDYDAIATIHEIRSFNMNQFQTLTAEYSKRPDMNVYYLKDKNNCIDKNVFMRWDKDSKSFHFKISNDNSGKKEWVVSSSHIRKLLQNTGWFELEVAQLLSRWEHAGKIQLNNELCFIPQNPNDKTYSTNEIDIIVEVGEKLLFVECKTGVKSITDVNKFNDVVKYYGGTGSKPVFFTYEVMNKKACDKCKNARIFYYNLKYVLNNPDKEKELFEKLDKYMSSINTR